MLTRDDREFVAEILDSRAKHTEQIAASMRKSDGGTDYWAENIGPYCAKLEAEAQRMRELSTKMCPSADTGVASVRGIE